jgi:hypothetical protein
MLAQDLAKKKPTASVRTVGRCSAMSFVLLV